MTTSGPGPAGGGPTGDERTGTGGTAGGYGTGGAGATGGTPGGGYGTTGATSEGGYGTTGGATGGYGTTGGGTTGGSTTGTTGGYGTTGGTTGGGTTGGYGTAGAPTRGGTGGGAGPSGMPSWTANITSREAMTGPAGTTYADVPSRIVAFIIDYVILFVVSLVVGVISNTIFGFNTPFGSIPTMTSLLAAAVLNLIVTAAYFIYTWTAMRASPGMRVVGLEVGHEADGRTLTINEAAVRYAVLFGPYILAALLAAFALGLSLIFTLLGIVWLVVLLVTVAQSPTRQALHDRYAKSVVLKVRAGIMG